MAKRSVEAGQRRAEITIALLFVVTAAASIFGGSLYEAVFSTPDYLAGIAPNRGPVATGALLTSVNNVGIVLIAVFAFPLLKKLDETLAVGYLAIRIIEGTLMMVGIGATLLMIPLSEEFLKAGSPSTGFGAISDAVLQFKDITLSTLSTVLLGLGGLIFSWLLFRFRLVPRLIGGLGLLGYALILVAGIGTWLGMIDLSPTNPSFVLALPVAVFEILVMPIWLALKGFSMPGASAGAAPPA